MSLFKELFRILRLRWGWVATQFVGIVLLILVGLAWTRIPDKHWWQVAFSLMLPLLLTISALELQAGTMRSFAVDDGKRVKLVWGAAALLVWVAVLWACWAILDWCDSQIPLWAGYLNSQAPAYARARLLTYDHIQLWFGIAEWLLRWVVVPAKVIPCAAASPQWGWRLPWRKILHFLWSWRWWTGVLIAALLGVALPSRFFNSLPSGTVHAQVWHIGLKLVGTYLLAVCSWVLLLGWLAVLFDSQKPLPQSDRVTELFHRLNLSNKWVTAQFGWVLVWIWVNVAVLHLPGVQRWPTGLSTGLGVTYRILIAIVALVVQAGMLRSLIGDTAKRVRLIWGTLALLLWAVLCLVAGSMQTYLPGRILQWLLAWIVAPAIFFPFAAASAVWGLRLPWLRVLRVARAWRWWVVVLLAGVVGVLAEVYFDGISNEPLWDVDLITGLKMGAVDMLETGIWIMLLGWLAVLFDRQNPPADEVLVPVPALVGPPDAAKEASVKLPLP